MSDQVPTAELVFRLAVECTSPVQLGRIAGGNAMMIPIVGGTVSGERLSGVVLPGGADWAILKDDGSIVTDARYAIQASDGTVIQIFNGASNRIVRDDGVPPRVLTAPRFVAPEGPHDWLNHGVFVGTLTADPSRPGPIQVGIYKLE